MYTHVPNGYYETEHWRRKRLEALRYHGFTCQACGRRGGWLDVHHFPEAYKHLWNEPLHLLRPLCHRSCHPKGRYSEYAIHLHRTAVPWRNAIEFLAWLPVRLVGFGLKQAAILLYRLVCRRG